MNQKIGLPPKKCIECPAYRQSVFEGLESALQDEVDNVKQRRVYAEEQTVVPSEESGPGGFCVSTGDVWRQYTGPSGKRHLLDMATAGMLVKDGPTEYCSRTAVSGCYIPGATLAKLEQNSPEFVKRLATQTETSEKRLEQRLKMLMEKTTPKRIAEALLFFCERRGPHGCPRKELADWAGTTVENVIRVLADFEVKKILSRKGRSVQIMDKQALQDLASL